MERNNCLLALKLAGASSCTLQIVQHYITCTLDIRNKCKKQLVKSVRTKQRVEYSITYIT